MEHYMEMTQLQPTSHFVKVFPTSPVVLSTLVHAGVKVLCKIGGMAEVEN